MTSAPAPQLRLERTFDATPQEVWTAWTDPKQYAQWFNPAGIDLVVHEWDLRPGGSIRFDMPQPDGNKNPQHGVFHVVSPYTRLVSGEADKSFLVDVTIEPRGASRAHVVVEVTGLPPEFRDMATLGWGLIFDRLEVRFAQWTPIRGQTWSIERTYDATPEQVWAALTTAEQYAQWISPFPGRDAEVHQFDARPGGRVRFTMTGPDGTAFPEMGFLFESLDKPREIVMFEANRDRDDMWNGHPMRVVMRLEPVGATRTRLWIQQSGLPESVPVEMAREGFGAGMEKLAEVLKRANP